MIDSNEFPTAAAVVKANKGLRKMRKSVKVRGYKHSTQEAYERDVNTFKERYGFEVPCKPKDLIAFIKIQMKCVAPVTIVRRCMAVQYAHSQAGYEVPTNDPTVREAMRWLAAGQLPGNLMDGGSDGQAIPTTKDKAKSRSANPIGRKLLLRMFDSMGTGARAKDKRDKAIMLLGYAGLKRSCICALSIEDLEFTQDACVIHLPQEGEEGSTESQHRPTGKRQIALPMTRGQMCPGTAVRSWLEHVELLDKTGPVFCRFDRSSDPMHGVRLDAAWINNIIKTRLKDAGVEELEGYSAESLRRGGAMERAK